MSIGNRLKNARQLMNITQSDLAQKVNITKQTIHKYENGVINNIPSDKLEILASTLGVTPSYLMGWEELSKTDKLISIKAKDIFIVSPSEQEHIKKYRPLNSNGKNKINEYLEDLLINPAYTENTTTKKMG